MRFIKDQKFLKMPFIEIISVSWKKKGEGVGVSN